MSSKKTYELPLRLVTKIPSVDLEFDPQNPRLISNMSGSGKLSDADIIKALNTEADIWELLDSISSNGYLDIEPLIVIEDPLPDKWKVLEGNRRLAAIKLFTNPRLAAESRIGDLPQISAEKLQSIQNISVYRVESEDEARSFIGFKHVNGPHKWDPYAKAIYAAQWYKSGKDNGLTIEDISRHIGDGHETISKMLWGVFALEQAKKENIYDLENRHKKKSFAFSHFYTALSRSEYREYLGIDPNSTDPSPDPVPKDKLDNLGNILTWLYGNNEDNQRPVIRTQNPDLKYLGAVIKNNAAVAILTETGDLDRAYEQTKPGSTIFSENMTRAKTAADIAVSRAKPDFGKDESLLQLSEDLYNVSSTIYETLKRVTTAPSPENKKISLDDLDKQQLLELIKALEAVK